VKKTVIGLSLIVAFLFSATAIVMYIEVASANPAIYLPVIEIKSDGRVVPGTSFIRQDGDVYTLTGDLLQKYAILIRRSNIVFDGAGHVIDGYFSPEDGIGWGYGNVGLSLEGVTNVTVKDIEVRGFMDADISIESSSESVLVRVKASRFHLRDSSFNTISESNIGGYDLLVYSSNNNIRP